MIVVSVAATIAVTNTRDSMIGNQAGPISNDRAVKPPCTNSDPVIARTEIHAWRYEVNHATTDTVVTMFAKM